MSKETRNQLSYKQPGAQESRVQEPGTELRDITVAEIFRRFDEQWTPDTVRVRIAQDGDSIKVPQEWHGANKYGKPNVGDAEVLFGSLLVEATEGTRLTPEAFVEGLKLQNFSYEDGKGVVLSSQEAVALISSDKSCQIVSPEDEIPIVRAVKNDREGKVIIEIRNGSMSPVMQELTIIGNDPVLDSNKKMRYRKAVSDCLGGFSAKGATAVRKRLGLYEYKRLTRFDDCLASGATIFGDQEVDDALGRNRERTLEEIRVAVASTQGITIAVKRALDRKMPLLIRVGALAYGLGSKKTGANYLMNTQPEMMALGAFTVGDMGDKLATGREGRINPHTRIYGPGKNETRIYLGGGLAMLELWEDKIREKNKTPDSVVCVLQASRINPPPGSDGEIHDWGVLMKGKKLPLFSPAS
ncbi:hypothetical protein KJZ67_04335 [Patescibacteria group bacterium]|nr:hypothetical protein [Patescibacteria group bacterium]